MTKSERERAHRALTDAMRVFDDAQCKAVDVIGIAKKKNLLAGMALNQACMFCINFARRSIAEDVRKLAPVMLDMMLDSEEEQRVIWTKFAESLPK